MDKYALKILKVTLTTFFLLIIFFLIIIGKNFLYPIALAILLSYLLFPIVSFFESKLKLPRILAILLAIILGLTLIFVIGEVILIQIKIFVRDFPIIKIQALDNINSFQVFIESKFKFTINEQQDWLRLQVSNLLESSNSFF